MYTYFFGSIVRRDGYLEVNGERVKETFFHSVSGEQQELLKDLVPSAMLGRLQEHIVKMKQAIPLELRGETEENN